MTVAQVRARARDIADVVGARWLSTDSEYNSLNEAYHDVYEAVTQTNDDYFLIPKVYSFSEATRSTNDDYEYFFELPDDFYKVRTVDYRQMGRWVDMRKFTLRERDGTNSEPMYRTANKTLWVVAPSPNTVYDIRIYYYPEPRLFILGTDDTSLIPYPTSLAPELLAYSMAADYKRRQALPTDLIDARKTEIWARYNDTLKRDDGKYETIQNVYSSRSQGWR